LQYFHVQVITAPTVKNVPEMSAQSSSASVTLGRVTFQPDR
jgi:hypothetical protein